MAPTSTPLAERNCTPCHAGAEPLGAAEVSALATHVPAWSVIENHKIERKFKFPDFLSALAFVNRIGPVAEQQGHHPDIVLGWGRVEVTLWTHAANGLTENDFILAAKIDRLVEV